MKKFLGMLVCLLVSSVVVASGHDHGDDRGGATNVSNINRNTNDLGNVNRNINDIDINSRNTSTNINDISNHQQQGQLQGQMQGQQQGQIAIGQGGTGGNSSSVSHGGQGGMGGQGGVGYGGDGGSSLQGQSQNVKDSGNANQNQQANNSGNNQTTNFNSPKQYHNTPSMPLFVPSPTATCMATIGGAGAGAGFGLSISGTYRSMHCEKVELAKTLNQLGQGEAALQVLCNVDPEHLEGVDLCEEIKEQRAERVAARKAKKEAAKPVQPTEVKPVSVVQPVRPERMDAQVTAENGDKGMFRYDSQSGEWKIYRWSAVTQ